MILGVCDSYKVVMPFSACGQCYFFLVNNVVIILTNLMVAKFYSYRASLVRRIGWDMKVQKLYVPRLARH